MYVVNYCGEYELDSMGFNVPRTETFDNLEDARAASQAWFEETGRIASIEES